MKKEMKRLYLKYKEKKTRKHHKKNMLAKVTKNNVAPLNSKEKEKLDMYWRKYKIKPDYNTYAWFKHSFGKFDPTFISEDVYACSILKLTNDMTRCEGLNDKNIFDIVFDNSLMPKTIARKIKGDYFDKDYNLISAQDILRICTKYDKVVVKPSVDSCQGIGVELVESDKILLKIQNSDDDFIIQELVHQHKDFAALNESSVNVVRLTTVLLHDEIVVVGPIIRVGAPGNFTDHFNVAIGIKDGGELDEYGIDTAGNKVYRLANGTIIKGRVIPKYKEMLNCVKRMHLHLPQAKIIGWDVCVDSNDDVVIIEANLNFPGIMRSQDCNGPLFGIHTEKVLGQFLGDRDNG